MSNLGSRNFSEDTDKNTTGGQVDSIVAGANVTVDNSDPVNPVVSASAAGGQVDSVVAGANINVDNTDPVNPVVSTSAQVATVVAGTNVTVDATDPANPIVSASGGASLPTTTKGDIVVHNGTTDVRLPVGTDGQVLEADSAAAEGVAWKTSSGGGGQTVVGGRFAPPTATTFPTWVNQQAGTVTDDQYEGFCLYDDTTDTGDDQFIARVKTMPSGTWTATCKIRPLFVTNQFNGVGMIMRDSATSRNVVFRFFQNGADYAVGVSNYAGNSFNSHVLLALDVIQTVQWLRIEDDGVNFLFSISANGVNWRQIASAGRTSWLAAPDQLGLFIDPENDNPVGITCSYWDDKDDPAVITSPTPQAALKGARLEVNTQIVSPALPYFVVYDTESYDTDGFADLGVDADRITIPAGVTKVRMTANVLTSAMSTGDSTNVWLAEYDAADTFLRYVARADSRSDFSTGGCSLDSGIMPVTPGYYYRLRVNSTDGSFNVNFANLGIEYIEGTL